MKLFNPTPRGFKLKYVWIVVFDTEYHTGTLSGCSVCLHYVYLIVLAHFPFFPVIPVLIFQLVAVAPWGRGIIHRIGLEFEFVFVEGRK